MPSTVTAEPSVSPREGWRAYLRLAKADSLAVFALPLAVGLSCLPHRLWTAGGAALVGLLAFAAAGGVFTATVALDDVHGYRDGSDAANYGARGDLRDGRRKPLLAGEMAPRQALLFAYTAWAGGALLWCGAVAASERRPPEALALVALLAVLAPQYSWGLRLSHRALGEALMMYFSVALVVAPHLLAGGRPGAAVAAQAALVGLWHVTVSSYANAADADGDRAIGRRTLATVLGPRGGRAYIGVLIAADCVLTPVVAWLSPAPLWCAAALLPVAMGRFRQVRHFRLTGDAHAANKRCWRLYVLGCLALVAANTAGAAATLR